MANPTRTETIRIEAQTDGKEIVAMSKDMRDLGVATQQAEQEANDLLKALDGNAQLEKVSGRLREASAATFEYQQKLRAAQTSIVELAAEERKLIAVENERATALAAAKTQLDAFKAGTHGLTGTTKEIAAAQKEARAQVKALNTAYNESVKARRAVTAALGEERKAATNAAAARDKELAKAKELRGELEASGKSASRLSATERQLAAESEALAARMRELVEQTRAAKTAAEEKQVADAAGKAEAEALARAVEIQADAFKAIARAEREAAANRDNTERSVERINDAFDAQSRKLAALRRDLLAAGASTEQLSEIERSLFLRAYEAAGGLQQEATAARTAANASARLAAVKEAERLQTLRNIQAQVAQRNAQIAATEALERYRNRGQAVVATNTSMGSSFSKLRTVIATAFSALGVGALVEGGKRILSLGASAERAQVQLRGLYGSAVEANQVFSQLQRVARAQGQDFETLLKAALRFKGVGLDPLNGSLQAVIDANARAGGSAERLEGIVLALSQTYAKQRIQMEELNQLSERQIPAMEILAKVTGKQGAELLKLVESGKLGKDVIKAFIDELGKMSKGAALENLKTLGGLFDAAKNRAEAFLRQIGDSGVLDFFKEKLTALIKKVDELEKRGDLARWATKISDAITGVSQAVINATKWVYDHSRAILLLGGAYASFKAAAFATQIYAATRNLIAATGAATAAAAATQSAAAAAATGTTAYQLLARALGAIRANPVILAIGAAAVYAANNLIDLANEIDNLREANRRLADEEDGARQAKDELLRKIQQLKQAGSDYRETIALTTEEIATLTETELFSYQQRLQRAQGYYRSLALEAKLAGDAAALKGAQENLAKIDASLARVTTRMEELDKAAANGSKRFTQFAKDAVEAFDKARQEGDSAREAAKKIFDDLDFTKTDALKSIPGVFEQIGARGRDAGVAIREGLTAALTELSGRELLKFQTNTEAAIRSGELHFQEGARILESTLLAAMQKLNVEPAKFGMGMTAAGKDAVATLKVITENVLASSDQIAAAFKSALAGATTKEEAIALGEAIKKAGLTGKIGLDQARDAAAAVALKLREIAIEADPLAADLEKLGVKTKAALDLARDSALRTFRAVVEGARQGKYAQDDVRAAFIKYAEAVRESTENSVSWRKSEAEAQLRVLASTNNLTDALVAMGDAGADAGKRTAAGAQAAADALDKTADSAGRAANSADALGNSAPTPLVVSATWPTRPRRRRSAPARRSSMRPSWRASSTASRSDWRRRRQRALRSISPTCRRRSPDTTS
jgi:tape measure domain-containing protein